MMAIGAQKGDVPPLCKYTAAVVSSVYINVHI